MSYIWPQDQTNWLRTNFREHASFAELTKAFNIFFNVERSRNSLIGKTMRMGLQSVPRKLPVPLRNYPQKKKRTYPPRKHVIKQPSLPPTRSESRRDCAWPADPPCMQKARIGSYCEVHARIAYRQMPDERRVRKLIYQ